LFLTGYLLDLGGSKFAATGGSKLPATLQGGFDVHVPVGPEQLFEGRFLIAGDSFFHLPEEVAHEPGDIDGILVFMHGEVFYKPFFGLLMDQLIEMADARFF